MIPCACSEPHESKRIVMTGGPGAGKTAMLELIRQSFCVHVRVLPEAAGILFGGGFPRDGASGVKRAGQRGIFHMQRELESAAEAGDAAIVLCDRGTIDGAAYWPGPGTLWDEIGARREDELLRYAAVIHLRTPPLGGGYDRTNPLRRESAVEAAAIDARIAEEWKGHARRFFVDAASDFLEKGRRALAILRAEMPECCRNHVVTTLDR